MDSDARGFGFPQAQAGVSQTNLNWITKWGESQNFDFFTFKQAELIKALHKVRLSGNF
jgi:hypothetical protein